MHFGRAIYFFNKGDVLTVVSPIDSTFAWVLGIAFLFTLGLFAATGSLRKVTPWIVIPALFLVIAGVTTSHAEVVLDGLQGRASVTTVVFYRTTHYTYPLSALRGADVGSSDQADALRLVYADGGSLQLTPYNQMGGKGQAALAINQFLSRHGGAESP